MNRKTTCLFVIFTLLSLPLSSNICFTIAQTNPTISFDPFTTQATQINQIITLNIVISNVQDLWMWDGTITWDPAVLSLVGNVQEGSFLWQAGDTVFIPTPPFNSLGIIQDVVDTLSTDAGASGSGILATIRFKVIAQSATTTIRFSNITLEGPIPASSPAGTPHPVITPTSPTATATITFATGGAPAADAGPAQTVKQGDTVTFNGSASLTSGSNPAYNWSFTDNGAKQLTGIHPTYTFNTPGIYLVTLTLTDSNGQSNSTVTITVQSASKPVPVITASGVGAGQSVASGQPVTFDGTGSYQPNNGTIAKYRWDLIKISKTVSNGTTVPLEPDPNLIGTNATLIYTFSIAEGLRMMVYNVTLTVFDATNQNNTAYYQVNVTPSTGQSPTPSSSSTPDSSSTPSTTVNVVGELPLMVTVIVLIVTIMVFGGATVWLRKRT